MCQRQGDEMAFADRDETDMGGTETDRLVSATKNAWVAKDRLIMYFAVLLGGHVVVISALLHFIGTKSRLRPISTWFVHARRHGEATTDHGINAICAQRPGAMALERSLAPWVLSII
jgi:hypothetical protein